MVFYHLVLYSWEVVLYEMGPGAVLYVRYFLERRKVRWLAIVRFPGSQERRILRETRVFHKTMYDTFWRGESYGGWLSYDFRVLERDGFYKRPRVFHKNISKMYVYIFLYVEMELYTCLAAKKEVSEAL